jgi:hypothetical protein
MCRNATGAASVTGLWFWLWFLVVDLVLDLVMPMATGPLSGAGVCGFAGPSYAMDGVREPPRMDSRRVPRTHTPPPSQGVPSPRFLLPASCFLLPASCFLLPASRFLLPASCFLLPASCFRILGNPNPQRPPQNVLAACPPTPTPPAQPRRTQHPVLHAFRFVILGKPKPHKPSTWPRSHRHTAVTKTSFHSSVAGETGPYPATE